MKSEVIIIGSEAFEELLTRINSIVKNAVAEATVQIEEDWLSGTEAKKLLGIKSKSKLQDLRDNLEIEFSQHGRTIRYSRQSILDFLNSNIQK
jgi:hypothetical protein